MDQRIISLITRFIDLNAKVSPDAKPLCSFVAQGDLVYMQERKFDADTGLEVSPLLTAIDLAAIDAFQDQITTFTESLQSMNTQAKVVAATIIKVPVGESTEPTVLHQPEGPPG